MKLSFFLIIVFFMNSCINHKDEKNVTKTPLKNKENYNLEQMSFPKDFNYNMSKEIELYLDTQDLIHIKIYEIDEVNHALKLATLNLMAPRTIHLNLKLNAKYILLEVKKDDKTRHYKKELTSDLVSFYF